MGPTPIRGEGAYKIKLTPENKIRVGSIGDTYKILRKEDNQICAARVWSSPNSIMTNMEMKYYEREVKRLQAIKHPFVVKLIDFFIYKNENQCIVTEYIEGNLLTKYMKNETSISEG